MSVDNILNMVADGAMAAASSSSWSAIWKTNAITPRIQRHLMKTYLTLTLTVLSCAAGVVLHITRGWGGMGSGLMMALCMIALAIDRNPAHASRRVGILAVLGWAQGLSLGPLFNMAMDIDPRIVSTALLGTATIFICFSLSALTAQRRSWLYLGGMLSSALSLLLLSRLVNLFASSLFLFYVELYVGLAIFCTFIIFDTQVMIEKAAQGDEDYVWAAMELFIDLVGIVVRLLIILMNNADKSKKKDTKEAKSSRR